MLKLDKDLRVIFVDHIREPFHPDRVRRLAKGELIGHPHAMAVHDSRDLRDDEAYTAPCPLLVEGDDVIADAPSRGRKVGPHGRHGHSVFQRQSPDGDRAVQ